MARGSSSSTRLARATARLTAHLPNRTARPRAREPGAEDAFDVVFGDGLAASGQDRAVATMIRLRNLSKQAVAGAMHAIATTGCSYECEREGVSWSNASANSRHSTEYSYASAATTATR
jgi:hypothetical protein